MKIKYSEKNEISPLLWIVLIVSIISTYSCKKFIDLTPLDRVDATTFFANADEVVIGVNGVYASQRSIYGGGSPYMIIESRSDNVAMIPVEQAERIEHDTFEETPGNLNVLNTWTPIYVTINLANLVIESSTNATGDADLINRCVAEAKFIRALSYFQLVTLYGGVPLRLTPTTDFSNTVVPRSDEAAVYDQIRQDLNDAIDVLPESYPGSTKNEKGRATKYAALTLLGKVELQAGDKTAAETAFRQVIGKYSLLPDYSSIWAAGNKNTAEAIFEVNFLPDNQTGLGLPTTFIPASEAARLGIAAGGSSVLTEFPTKDIIDAFEAGDLRKDASIAFAVADGTAYISKFMDLNAATYGHNINWIVLRYADVLLSLAEIVGEGTEAYGLINQVRERAGLPDIDATTPGTFMEKLMHERQVEFAFEMQRWNDLLRLPPQEAIDIMKADLLRERGNDYTITPDNLLYPIPLTEIQVSKGAVTQNPGHEQ
jgi:starch-binding outer membrane protein, SusD/RagB family